MRLTKGSEIVSNEKGPVKGVISKIICGYFVLNRQTQRCCYIKNLWDKIELYIISLWLLFLLIIIVTIDIPIYFGEDWIFIGLTTLMKKNIIPLISLFFLIVGLIFISRFNYKISGSKKTPFKIISIQNENYQHLAFLSTYIIPLIAFDLSKIKYVIVLMVLLIVIGAIYIRTNIFHANPSLALLGFRIYKCEGEFRTGQNKDVIIISRQSLMVGMKVSYLELDENIYYVRVAK
ncbi:anti-phage protein KwaA [Paenibacillus tarimensis]